MSPMTTKQLQPWPTRRVLGLEWPAFLWREDALALLERRNAASGVRGKTRLAMWERICEVRDIEEIAAAARARLKSRKDLSKPARPS
jgi:hypothetical protein